MNQEKFYIFFPSLEKNKERVPRCIENDPNLCICEQTGSGVFFNKPPVYCWHEMKRRILSAYEKLGEYPNNIRWVIFCHSRDVFSAEILEIENEKGHENTLDYSSGDTDQYEAMWNDINTASNCCELVERLEYWVNHYTIDPVSRIKHRAINLFHAISLDCQKLYELAESGNKKELKSYLQSLSELWKSSGISPTEKLKILWYMLVGKVLENGRYIPNNKEEVSLPGNLDLYSWLRKIKSNDSISNWKEWKELINHCQVYQEDIGGFRLKGVGICNYCLLQRCII